MKMRTIMALVVAAVCMAACSTTDLLTGSTAQYGVAVSTVASDVSVTLGANQVDYVSTPVVISGANGSAPLLVTNECGENDVVSIAGSLTGNATSGSALNPAVTLNVGRGLWAGEAAKEQGYATILAAAGGGANASAADIITAVRACRGKEKAATTTPATTAAAATTTTATATPAAK